MAYGSVAVTAGTGTTLTTVPANGNHAFVKAVGLDAGGAGSYQVISVNTGTMDAGTIRVTLATDSSGQVKLAAGAAEFGKLAAGVAEIGNVKNAGVFAVQEDGPAATSLALLDDVVATDDTTQHAATTTKGYNIMAVATPTGTSVGSNDIGMLAMSLDRRLLVDCDLVAHTGTTITVDAANDNSFVAQLGDGTLLATIRNTGASDSLNVAIVDGSGNQITSFGGSGGTSSTDSDAYTKESSTFTPGGGAFDDATPDSLTEGQMGLFRMSANRNQYTTIRDAAGNERGVNVDASNQLGVVEASGAAILLDTTAILADTATISGAVTGTEMQVDVITMPSTAVTNAGTFAVQADSVIPGTGATNLGKAIASVVGVTDTGVAGLAEVSANQTSTIPESSPGVYTPLRISAQGNLHTSDLAISLSTVAAGSAAPVTALNCGAVDSTNTLREIRCNTTGQLEVALVAGTAAIGKLAANSGVDIGDVDVLSSALPTGAATSAAQLADGHNVTIDNSTGGAAVNIQDGGNSITIDGSVTADLGANNDVVVSGTDAENANVTANPVLAGGRFDTAARTVLGNTDAGAFAVNAYSAQHTVETVSQKVYKGVAYDVLYAFVNASGTTTELVNAPAASTSILVLSAQVNNSDTAVRTVHFESATTEITMGMDLAADGGGGMFNVPFQTASAEALNVETTPSATAVGVQIAYIEVLT